MKGRTYNIIIGEIFAHFRHVLHSNQFWYVIMNRIWVTMEDMTDRNLDLDIDNKHSDHVTKFIDKILLVKKKGKCRGLFRIDYR